MALVAHTIVSRYVPQQREPPTPATTPEDDPWQTESSFGPTRRLNSRPPPNFVEAALKYDEYGMPRSELVASKTQAKSDAVPDVSAWYRSLTSKGSSRHHASSDELSQPLSDTRTLPTHVLSRDTSRCQPTLPEPPPRSKSTDWFGTTRWTAGAAGSTPKPMSQPSAFADLLSRNPPPLPSEPAFKPPIFLALGPGNKGFTMLERKGWQEGEGLGSARVERKFEENSDLHWVDDWSVLDESTCQSKYSAARLMVDSTAEVIDLTDTTDSESQQDLDMELTHEGEKPEPLDPKSHGMTLLTPITTTLKADRLGIGLKARRRSSKAVSHTSAALAAHIRDGAKLRKEKSKYGRGSRGFAKIKKKDERARLEMLSYLNA